MRRLQIAIVVPIALLTAIVITASAADAGKNPHSVKSKVAIKSASTSKATDTWIFKGKVTSKNHKCVAGRRVKIFVAEPLRQKGAAPEGPVAKGRTKANGRFVADTHQQLLLVAKYRAVVAEREHKDVTCMSAESKEFLPPFA